MDQNKIKKGPKVRLVILLTLIPFLAICQRTKVYTDFDAAFKRGQELYDLGLFSLAQLEFEQVLNMKLPVAEPQFELVRIKSELLYAKSAVHLEKSDGQKLMMSFVNKYQPDPIANEALFDLANHYLNDKKYEEAITYLEAVDVRGLGLNQAAEIKFKHGYSLFVLKRFADAKEKFAEIRDLKSEYYEQSNYYFGMAAFYEGNYEQALRSWQRIERSGRYRAVIPYYIAQIYFDQERYDELVIYAEPLLTDSKIRNQTDLHLLVGQAYFEMGDFEEALPHLEYYESRSRQIREEDFYLLGTVQYTLGHYDKAIENFKHLDQSDSPLGQSAMYYLAEAYLKVGDLTSARNAFNKCAGYEYDLKMQEEALYHYARISLELGFDREAIRAFQRFLPESAYRSKAQDLLAKTLENTRDYKTGIRIIESLPDRTPRLQEAYQKISYSQGIKDFYEKNYPEALAYFDKSLSLPVNPRYKAMATFWVAEIQYINGEFTISTGTFNRFITLANAVDDLPPASSVAGANYSLGYNYLNNEDYVKSFHHFSEAISEIKKSSELLKDPQMGLQILPDAYLRAGDCQFKRNRYADAMTFYQAAIDLNAPGYEYAFFQRALIHGLRGRTAEKIITLEEFVTDFPNSPYADDALLEIGNTYQSIGRLEDAISSLDRLIRQYKNSNLQNEAYLKMGLISYNLGNLSDALQYYKAIFQKNPSSKEAKDALKAIEEIYVEDLGRADEFVQFVESVPGYRVSIDEKDSLYFQVAERHYENGSYQLAIQEYTEYIRRYPSGFNVLLAYYHRAESNSILKNYDAALKDYDLIISKGRSAYYQDALEKGALISYNHAESFEKALKYYAELESVAADENDRFEAQLGAMRSAYRTGNKAQAKEYASKVINNSRSSTEQVAVARYYRAKIAFEEKNYDEALDLFKKVAQNSNNENTAESRYHIGYIYYLKKDWNAAESACRQAFEMSSAYPFWVAKSLILLSDVLVEKDDLFNAKAALEAVIDNFTEDEELVAIAQAKFRQIEIEENRKNRILEEDLNPQQLRLDNVNN